jgi:hypothetical protein
MPEIELPGWAGYAFAVLTLLLSPRRYVEAGSARRISVSGTPSNSSISPILYGFSLPHTAHRRWNTWHF